MKRSRSLHAKMQLAKTLKRQIEDVFIDITLKHYSSRAMDNDPVIHVEPSLDDTHPVLKINIVGKGLLLTLYQNSLGTINHIWSKRLTSPITEEIFFWNFLEKLRLSGFFRPGK